MSFFTDIAKLATFLAYLVFLSFLDKEFVYFFLPTREKRLQYFQSRQPQIYGLFSSWRIVCSNTLWLPSPPHIRGQLSQKVLWGVELQVGRQTQSLSWGFPGLQAACDPYCPTQVSCAVSVYCV